MNLSVPPVRTGCCGDGDPKDERHAEGFAFAPVLRSKRGEHMEHMENLSLPPPPRNLGVHPGGRPNCHEGMSCPRHLRLLPLTVRDTPCMSVVRKHFRTLGGVSKICLTTRAACKTASHPLHFAPGSKVVMHSLRPARLLRNFWFEIRAAFTVSAASAGSVSAAFGFGPKV